MGVLVDLERDDEAAGRVDELMSLCRRSPERENIGIGQQLVADLHRRAGRIPEAVTAATAAMEVFREVGVPFLISLGASGYARASFAAGDAEAARGACVEGLEAAVQCGDYSAARDILHALADLSADTDGPAAIEFLALADATAAHLGMVASPATESDIGRIRARALDAGGRANSQPPANPPTPPAEAVQRALYRLRQPRP